MMALEIVKHHLNQFQLGEDSFEYARYGINVPGIRHWNPNREIDHSHRIYLPIYKAKNFPEAMVELMPALVYSYLKTRAGILGPAHKNDYFSARSFGANAGATFVVDSLALEPGMHLSGWVEQLGVDAPFIKWVSGSHLEEGEERSVTEELTAQAVEGAGGGDRGLGSERMMNMMRNFDQGGQPSAESQGLGSMEETTMTEMVGPEGMMMEGAMMEGAI